MCVVGGGGGYLVPQRVWFLSCFIGIYFNHLGLKMGMAFKGNHKSRTFRSHVRKRVWILEARSENGCGKWHVLV